MIGKKKKLVLYTTLGCSLCEKAKLEIWPAIENHGLALQEVDIAEDPELFTAFGTRIPVVGLGDKRDVLGWPFTAQELGDWIGVRL
ncbi:glutaredoxin family protein [Biformimicrobium ophioploci]|uniref:Glutaredoxin family protein n=1 Tax=Biformimicrobium ophioploci TaxID=3036711 RepID=A0ABQ6M1I5_9GAMM|nr:glutaredoxin family protein [Microbulbifer sp. NKW57]GMG88156.1 glutaredoxin family protein [Microbulbifer sp. NKW57]